MKVLIAEEPVVIAFAIVGIGLDPFTIADRITIADH
jgi:hypothetical protein|tara:strand:- start:282 stop:389 length:108 start_codon:yes stop_codon:yes gene_type:complete